MGNGRIFSEIDYEEIFLGVANRFVYREGCVARFAKPHADLAFFIADDYTNRESEPPPARDNACDAPYVDQPLIKLAPYARSASPGAARTAPPVARGARFFWSYHNNFCIFFYYFFSHIKI